MLRHIVIKLAKIKDKEKLLKAARKGTSLVAQWLRICLPVQGMWVQSLVRELDPTCMPQLRSPLAATKEHIGCN